MGGQALRIVADTNLLVRILTQDNPRQARLAEAAFEEATEVVITPTALCEVAWVLLSGYEASRSQVASAIRLLMNSANAVVDRPAVESGLAVLDEGGDFADGVIAFEGRRMGGDALVSFDKGAVEIMTRLGQSSRLLA